MGENSGGRDNTGDDVLVLPQEDIQTKEPTQYQVVLLNDDFTPMDFVIHILKAVFRRTHTEAVDVMMRVHTSGRGVAGVYSHEIAETKMHQVIEAARAQQHPLQCIIEEV